VVATGTATVTWTATDACGNTTTTSASVTIQDTTAPVFTTVPSNLTLECDGAGNIAAITAWLNSAVASDVCGSVSISHNYTGLSDLCGATGTATVTWTATDACGNNVTTSAAVTVEDTTPPSITCPTNMVVAADTDEVFATVTVPVLNVTDICGTIVLVNDYNGTGDASDQYPLGTTTVTWTATDTCGNQSSCSFTITVQDEEDPVILCPPTIVVSCTNEIPEAYSNYDEFVAAGGIAYDNNEIIESSFTLISETSNGGSCPETITRVYQIADNDGNTSTCSQQIIINDFTAPTFTIIPEDLTVECDGEGNTSELSDWLANIAATDNCSEPNITNDFVELTEGCGNTGSVTVTWTATDACGNSRHNFSNIYNC
jgi:large repetitive protein